MKDSGFVSFFFLNLKALDEDYVTMAEVPRMLVMDVRYEYFFFALTRFASGFTP